MAYAAEQLALFAELPLAARRRKSAINARYFFALWPTEQVRSQLAEAAARIPPGAARVLRIKPERYHLTLAFLGALQARQIDAAQRAAHALYASAFRLRLDQIGFSDTSRTAWVGPRAVASGLLRLKAELDRELLHLGLPVERSVFRPQVNCLRGLDDAPDAPDVNIDWAIDEFVLMRSSSRNGVTCYKRVARWRLPISRSASIDGNLGSQTV